MVIRIVLGLLLVIGSLLLYNFNENSSDPTPIQESVEVEAGRKHLYDVIIPQTWIFTEADQYINEVAYHKEQDTEYIELSVEQIANSEIPILRISNKDYLWNSYYTLLNFPPGTPITFYHREMVMSEIHDDIPLADYLIPVVINLNWFRTPQAN